MDHIMMNTDWSVEKTSLLFDAYDDYVETALGYNKVITTLRRQVELHEPVMDYGCGGGKVSERLIAAGFTSVTGFDISFTMVERARDRVRSGARFEQVTSGIIPHADETFAGAICCYVFINVPDRTSLSRIAGEIFRALKPGAPFLILDTNPNSTGVKFATFQNGDVSKLYADGQSRNVYLDLPDGRVFQIVDTHWEHETYREILQGAGFIDISVIEPTAGDLEADVANVLGVAERTHPPFVIFSGYKPPKGVLV